MLDESTIPSQTQHVFSVSEISYKIKNLLEQELGIVQIKGEISGLKIATSGHGYFSLKDQQAVISAICWKAILSKINFKLEDGLEVIIRGKITAYAGQSKYQISVESIQPSGVGAFMKILAERKARFEKEGLFDISHKKKIPFLPKKIGIVTSLSGAVIRDIIHRINERCKTHIVIWPVSVQGNGAAEEVAKAIDGFNQLPEEHKPELLIIARGGGSIEDLWAFNEEIVVRAAFASSIPLISAIGHETDYSLLDLVADRRAPTPTAAAEFSVPVAYDLRNILDNLEKRLTTRIYDFANLYKHKLSATNSLSSNMQSIIRFYQQKMDEISLKYDGVLPKFLTYKIMELKQFSLSHLTILKAIKYKALQYKNTRDSFIKQKNTIFKEQDHRLNMLSSYLNSLDYKKVLQRGYSVVRDLDDNIISSTNNISSKAELFLEMKDGRIKIKSL